MGGGGAASFAEDDKQKGSTKRKIKGFMYKNCCHPMCPVDQDAPVSPGLPCKTSYIHFYTLQHIGQELCESRGVRPNEPYGFRGRKAILNRASALVSACL